MGNCKFLSPFPQSAFLSFIASISPASAACNSSEMTLSSKPRARAVPSAAVMSMPTTRPEGAMRSCPSDAVRTSQAWCSSNATGACSR